MSKPLIGLSIFLLWLALFLVAIVHDLRASGDWDDLRLRRRIWHSICDVGDPQRYVHMFYGECSRDWCYCHQEKGNGQPEEPSA